jgi:hypothetical protein
MFLEELTTAPTWHEWVASDIYTCKSYEASASGGYESGDQATFSAECESVTSIFNIAPGDDATIIDERCNANRKL